MSTLGTIEGTVIDSTGPIFAMRNGAQIELAINDPVYESDIITTGNETTADILYRDGTKSRIAPNTNFTLTDYEFGSNVEPSFVMDLTRGAVRTVTGEIVERNPEAFEVITPRATVGIRGTEFMNSVDSSTNIETHAVLYISEGSIMLVTDAAGNSLSLDAPLQVTQFVGGSTAANGVSSFTLGQMQSVLQVIAPTLSTNIPQTDAQQGQWESVQQVLIDQREQEEQEEQARELEAEANQAENEANNAEQAILDNPPTGAVQDNIILISLGDADADNLDALFEALEEAGFTVIFANNDDYDDDDDDFLSDLYDDAQEALTRPALAGRDDDDDDDDDNDDDSQPEPAQDIAINFTRYTGGALTDTTGKTYKGEQLEESNENFNLTGFEMHGVYQGDGAKGNSIELELGNGNDSITLGATVSGANAYGYDLTPVNTQSTIALYNTELAMGNGNDSLYIDHNPSNLGASGNFSIYESNIAMGDGNDSITIKRGDVQFATIKTENGDDSIIIESLLNGNVNIETGDGHDNIVITQMQNSDMQLQTGNGNDFALIGENYSNNSALGINVSLGNDNDILVATQAADFTNNSPQGGNDLDLLIGRAPTESVQFNLQGMEFEAYIQYDNNAISQLDSKQDVADILDVKVSGDKVYLLDSAWSTFDGSNASYAHDSGAELVFNGITEDVDIIRVTQNTFNSIIV